MSITGRASFEPELAIVEAVEATRVVGRRCLALEKRQDCRRGRCARTGAGRRHQDLLPKSCRFGHWHENEAVGELRRPVPRQVSEQQTSVREIVQQRIRDVAMLDPELAGKRQDLAPEHGRRKVGSKQRRHGRPVLRSGTALAVGRGDDAKVALRQGFETGNPLAPIAAQQEPETPVTREDPGRGRHHAGGGQALHHRLAEHDDIRIDAAVGVDWQQGIAAAESALLQAGDNERLRQGHDEDLGRPDAERAALGGRGKGIENERQQHGEVVAFGEDGQPRAAIDWPDEVGDAVRVPAPSRNASTRSRPSFVMPKSGQATGCACPDPADPAIASAASRRLARPVIGSTIPSAFSASAASSTSPRHRPHTADRARDTSQSMV